MQNYQIYIDSNSKKLVDTNGSILTTFPSISVGSTPTLDIHLVNNLVPIDVSNATAWRFAIDTDFLSGTTPMARTTNDNIDSTYASSGLISVEVDTNTQEFIDKVDGRDSVNAYGELYGLDSETNIIYDYRFRINALGTVDYNGGTPTPIEDDGITKTEVQAMINALSISGTTYTLPTATSTTLGGIKVGDNLSISNGVLSVDSTLTSQISTLQTGVSNAQSMASSAQTTAGQANITASNLSSNLTTHTNNSNIHVPSSGTTGYVLTKTSSGSEWAALPSSSSSGSTTTSTDAVEKLTTLPDTWTSDDNGRVFVWSTSDTATVKQGHIYKVTGSETSITISGSTLSGHDSITTIDGVYTPYKTGEVTFSDGTLGTGVIAYANEDKSIFIFQTKFSSGTSMLVWAIYTEVKEYIGGPPVAFAYFNATSSGSTYYTPTASEICNKTWLSAYTTSTGGSTYSFSKGTWTASEGSTELTDITASASSGSTTTSTDAVEKLSAEFTPTESDLGKVYLWSVDDTTNMKKGHLYKVSSKEVTTTTESSGGSGEGFTINGSNNSEYGSFDGTYTSYKTGQGYAGMTYNTGSARSDETNRTTNIVTTCYANEDKTKFVFEESYLGTIQWIIHTAETLNNSSPPQCCAITHAWTSSNNINTYYDPTVEQICNDLAWSAGWTSSYTQSTFTKGTWTPLSSGTTTTTETVYYLEDITVECPVVNAYKEATDTIVYPSLKPYKITADDVTYIGAGGGVSGQVGYAEVVVKVGASGSVLAGDNLTLVDSLTAGKTNYCVVRWDGLSGQLFVWRTE